MRAAKISALVLAGGLIAGCTREPQKQTILEARPQPYVGDLPVPARFEINDHNSRHMFVAGRRRVKHYYEGKDSPLAVRNFYVHYMPTAGWEQVNENLMGSVYSLTYRKGEERCSIRVEPSPSGMFGGTKTIVKATIRSEADADTSD